MQKSTDRDRKMAMSSNTIAGLDVCEFHPALYAILTEYAKLVILRRLDCSAFQGLNTEDQFDPSEEEAVACGGVLLAVNKCVELSPD